MRKQHDEAIDVYHGTSKKVNHIIHSSNLLVLTTYFPTQHFDSPKLNQPLAQFIYNRGKRSPFMTRQDAINLKKLVHQAMQLPPDSLETRTTILSFGRVEVSGVYLRFPDTGERYTTWDRYERKTWLKTLSEALTKFIDTDQGDEYPFVYSSRFENGVTIDSLFALTHHGDESYGQVPSFLRYLHSTNGLGGAMTIQYGLTQLHVGTSHLRGESLLNFIDEIMNAVTKVSTITQTNERFVRERLYESHPVLNAYNCYVSAVRESRGILMTISTDLSIVNNKISFVIKDSNLKQLHTFLKTITLYLKKGDVK